MIPASLLSYFRLIGCFLLALFAGSLVVNAEPNSAAWPKSFYDEFNGTSIDTSKWFIGQYPWYAHVLLGGAGSPNYSASYSTTADSYETGGNLVLRCRASDGSSAFGGYAYSFGVASSGYPGKWTYGYIEVRAKYPSGNEVWPAFWMLDNSWPPEVDIAEYFGNTAQMHNGIAYGSGAGTWDNTYFGGTFTGFRTYGFEWGPGYAIFYMDGVPTKTVYASYVPTASLYVLFNSGMRALGVSTTTPNYYYIDYIRYYSPPAAAIDDATTGSGQNQCSYAGTWGTTSYSDCFFGSIHNSSTVNSTCTINFTGTRVDVSGRKSPTQGIAGYSIDGGAEVPVDYYSSSFIDSTLVWSAVSLPSGPHTLTIRVTGNKNASSTGTAITVDRVDAWKVRAPLTGTRIGTAGTYSGNNTNDKAMDGNLDTYFDAPAANADNAWVGLDLGVAKQVTSVRFCARSGYASRMVGGQFQGANQPDFSDAVTLYTVAAAPVDGNMITQSVSNSTGFRYLRYLGPTAGYGDIAELEFYGTDPGAASGTWTADADGDWDDSNNWSGGTIGFGAGNTANFSTIDITSNRTVNLDDQRTIGTLKFGDTSGAQNWTLSSADGDPITLDTGVGTSPTILVNQNNATIYSPLDGTSGFVKDGVGTLTLAAGSSTLTGVLYVDGNSLTASDGAVCIANSGAISQVSSPINIRNNNSGSSTFQLGGGQNPVTVTQSIALSGRNVAVPSIENVSGSNTLSGNISFYVGGTNYWMQSDSGVLNYSGTIASTTSGARTVRFQGPGDNLITGVIGNGSGGGTVGVSKIDAGTLTLAGISTYTGPTTISAGTFTILGGIAKTGTLSTAVNTLFTGLGSCPAPTIISGTHAPGYPVGFQTISGPLTYAATSHLTWTLAANNSSPSSGVYASNLTAVSGATIDLNLNGPGSIVDLLDPFWSTPQSWTFIYAVSISGSFKLGAISTDSLGRSGTSFGTFSIQAAPTSITVNYTPLPLPQWQKWAMASFGANWNNPALSGDTVCPANDGLSNLMKYALGVPPMVPSSTSGPVISNTNGSLTMSFTRNTAATDVTMTVVGADSPGGTWTPLASSSNGQVFSVIANGATAVESGSGTLRNVQVGDQYLSNDPAHPNRFLKLKVSH